MSFKKNQKRYNKEVMRTGREANQYLRNALGLINQYTTDYAGRNEFWLNKLNDRQLNLLSDKYLAENANMLRGSAAFGSNSKLNRQMNENAYSQQNYLANVANQNVMNANQLQNNELEALMGASNAYNAPIQQGATAAQNVDAANNAWLGAVGQGLNAVGNVVQFMPGVGSAIGSGMQLAGGALQGISGSSNPYNTAEQNVLGYRVGWGNASIPGSTGLGNAMTKLSTNKGSNSQFSIIEPYNPLNPNQQNSNYGK